MSWTVHPHGPLVDVADGVWIVDGELPGIPFPRRMTIVRRADGSVLLHSGVAVDDALLAQVRALGPVSMIVVPGKYHRTDAPHWKARCPEARVVCPRGSRKAVAKVVAVDATYDEIAADARVRFAYFDGVGESEGFIEVTGGDGVTLVVNDAIFNLPPLQGFLKGVLYQRGLRNGPGPAVTSLFRWLAMKDKRAYFAHLERLSHVPGLARIVMSHGAVIDEGAAAVLAELARKQ